MKNLSVSPRDIWMVGPHTLICGDLEDLACRRALTETPADVIYCDPPWSAGHGTMFRNKAQKAFPEGWPAYKVDFNLLMYHTAQVWQTCPGDVFIEMSSQGKWWERMVAVIEFTGGALLDRWEVTYQEKLPARLGRFRWQNKEAVWDGPDFSGMDDAITPLRVFQRYPAHTIAVDTNTGLGTTPMSALKAGIVFRGMEINTDKVRHTLGLMSRYTGDQPRLVGQVA